MKYYASNENTQKGCSADQWNEEYPIAIIHQDELKSAVKVCEYTSCNEWENYIILDEVEAFFADILVDEVSIMPNN